MGFTHQDLSVGGEDFAHERVHRPVGPLALAVAVANGVARGARAQPHAAGATLRRAAGPARGAKALCLRLMARQVLLGIFEAPGPEGLRDEHGRQDLAY